MHIWTSVIKCAIEIIFHITAPEYICIVCPFSNLWLTNRHALTLIWPHKETHTNFPGLGGWHKWMCERVSIKIRWPSKPNIWSFSGRNQNNGGFVCVSIWANSADTWTNTCYLFHWNHYWFDLINTTVGTQSGAGLVISNKVVPLHKKGSKYNPSNYRQVSISSALSKIIEIIVQEQMNEYISNSRLTFYMSCNQVFENMLAVSNRPY